MLTDIMTEAFGFSTEATISSTARGVIAKNSLDETVEARMVQTPQGMTIIVEVGEGSTYNRFEFVGVERNDARNIAKAIDLLFN